MKGKYLGFSLAVLLSCFGTNAHAQNSFSIGSPLTGTSTTTTNNSWYMLLTPQHLLVNQVVVVPSPTTPLIGLDYVYSSVLSPNVVTREIHTVNAQTTESMFNDSALIESLLHTVPCKNNVTAFIKSKPAVGSTSIVNTNLLAPEYATTTNPLCAYANNTFSSFVPAETSSSLQTKQCGNKTCLVLSNPKITNVSISTAQQDILSTSTTHQKRLQLEVTATALISSGGKQHYANFKYKIADKGTAGVIDAADQPSLQHLEDTFTILRGVASANSKFAPLIEVTIDSTFAIDANTIIYSATFNSLRVRRSR